MTALSFVWVHPYSQNSRCDNKNKQCYWSKVISSIPKIICWILCLMFSIQ